MFPGTSRQTPREPDLGNPYRVDLGTAIFGMGTAREYDDQLQKKQRSWIGRAATQHDDNAGHGAHARYDTHAGHDAHAKHDANTDNTIAEMEAEHNKSKAAHLVHEQNVRETETRLRDYGNQLQRVKDTQEEKKNAESARQEAENSKRKSERDLEAAHSKMKEEMARLKQLKPGTASHQTSGR